MAIYLWKRGSKAVVEIIYKYDTTCFHYCYCLARVTVLGLCVCLCVYDYSRTTGYEAAYERYQQLQCYKGMKNNVAILLKRLRSRGIWRENKRKSQYT